MGRAKRKAHRRAKSEARRAEAIANKPQMLASEQALRDMLDGLHERTSAVARHARYDDKVRAAIAECVELNDRLQIQIRKFIEAYGELVGAQLLGRDTEPYLQVAQQALDEWERLFPIADDLLEQYITLLQERADISVTPVDRAALNAGIERIRAHLANVAKQAGINRRRLEDERASLGRR
jgi:hypothetical protein